MGGPQLNGFDGDVGSMIVWLAMIGAYNDFFVGGVVGLNRWWMWVWMWL
jgi:hypothetical protein